MSPRKAAKAFRETTRRNRSSTACSSPSAAGRTRRSPASRRRGEGRSKGFIETDAQRRTAEPSIFAIGDVAGEPMLAHKASHEARVAVEAIAGHKAVFEPQAIPAVVFTDPEIAWCGLTEAQAQAEGVEFEVAKFPWGALSRAITVDRPEGLTKLVLEPSPPAACSALASPARARAS